MKRRLPFGIFLFICVFVFYNFYPLPDWGFFAHRRINRMAVFTLPLEMILFYKQNIEYITSHAVDPDKRRYATRHEAVRHYIDIDHWGQAPFPELPRDWLSVLVKHTDLYAIDSNNDTLKLINSKQHRYEDGELILENSFIARRFGRENYRLNQEQYKDYFRSYILPLYYEDEWELSGEKLQIWLEEQGLRLELRQAFAVDNFSAYGILPYFLPQMQRRLTQAFSDGNIQRILQLSADFGHYIGDAHVPLHTTVNYNGQLTDQVGIHAFWESRIPELFADDNFDFFVGKAEYIEDPKKYFWDIVLASHSYVDSVLLIEKTLSQSFPADQQYCFEERLDRTIRIQCRAYAEAYRKRMKGMVEKRMQQSIHAIGSAWYTAWIDAGQPDLERLGKYSLSKKDRQLLEEREALFRRGEAKGRKHDN